MLHQLLDIKHREVELRAHPREWKHIITAMEVQFRPLIRKPLDLPEIKDLCEQAARPSTNDLCMLAVLNAYLGNHEEALSFCERIQSLPPPPLAARLDWEQRHKAFGLQLQQAITSGEARQFLDAAAASAADLT
jgi:hypothetical protein